MMTLSSLFFQSPGYFRYHKFQVECNRDLLLTAYPAGNTSHKPFQGAEETLQQLKEDTSTESSGWLPVR